MSAQETYQKLLETEISSKGDKQVVIRDERVALGQALESRNPKKIAAAAAEAQRVMKMWEGR